MLSRTTLALAVILCALAPARGDEPKSWPACVLIIRHAEKPDIGEGLAAKGKERAEALPRLFDENKGLPKPDFIFAARDSKQSRRSTATVAPLAKKLGLTVNDGYANGDFAKLAQELSTDRKYAGKTVLICWHHGNIPELARKLGAEKAKEWKGETYDRVWRLDYGRKGKATWTDLPQHLLSGDAKK